MAPDDPDAPGPADPPASALERRIGELLALVRDDPLDADPRRTDETMRTARWQVGTRRFLHGGHGFLAAFGDAVATLLRLRRHDTRGGND